MEVRRVDLANWALRLHENSPQGLNICSIRVFGKVRDLEILITVCLTKYSELFFITLSVRGSQMKSEYPT